MPRRRPDWWVQRPKEFEFDFFISHVKEDRADIEKLKAEISAASGKGGRPEFKCFLDIHNWPSVNNLDGIIKEFLLKSKYMVAWVTPSFLQNDRGWIWIEMAYAELEQSGERFANPANPLPFIVPVFRDVTINDAGKPPLLSHWQHDLLGHKPDLTVKEIAVKLVDFHHQESYRAEQR